MTGDVINLNKARKARDKAAKDAQAQQNRGRFGRSKVEKTQAQTLAEKMKRALDDAKRDPDRP